LAQPVEKSGAALFDRVIAGLVQRVADNKKRPEWYADSFFRRFAK
jgi:hypothetical protein